MKNNTSVHRIVRWLLVTIFTGFSVEQCWLFKRKFLIILKSVTKICINSPKINGNGQKTSHKATAVSCSKFKNDTQNDTVTLHVKAL